MSSILIYLAKVDSFESRVLIAIASGIGIYLSISHSQRKEKEGTRIYYINTKTRKESKQLADNLRSYGLQTSAVESYNDNRKSILKLMVVSKSKKDSITIESNLPSGAKITVIPAISYEIYEKEVR